MLVKLKFSSYSRSVYFISLFLNPRRAFDCKRGIQISPVLHLSKVACVPNHQRKMHFHVNGYFSSVNYIPKLNFCSTSDTGKFEEKQETEATLDDEDDIEDLLKYDVALYRTHRIPGVGHNVIVVQPKVKWGPNKKTNTTPQLQLDEAAALVETLSDWHVVGKMIIPVTNPKQKLMFGSGNLEKIKDMVSKNSLVSALFISCDILTSVQQKELEKFFGYPVFDRYSIVLQIFHDHARTKEAKLQVALAEIPYIRARLRELYEKGKDRAGGGNRYISGSGETFLELKKRLLMGREIKLRRALESVRQKREILRSQRIKKEFPVIAVVGYTNSGKTTMIKSLTQDRSMEPKDHLFATLDVTAHLGLLPSYQKVLYIDTVGFISDIPTMLIQSFTATLEDVTLADLIIHIRDISHPDCIAQKDTVLKTLEQLNLSDHLLENIIEVGNKIDLVDSPEELQENKDIHLISATKGTGLQLLKQEVENRILSNTGRVIKTFRVPMGGEEARWLYKQSGVKSAVACEVDPNFLIMNVVITKASVQRFFSYFGDMTVSQK